MAMQKEASARRDHLILLRISVLVAVLLSGGLFVLGARSPYDAASHAGISIANTSDSQVREIEAASPQPVAMGTADGSPQRKLLAVMVTALAAVLLWLWRELPLRRRTRQWH